MSNVINFTGVWREREVNKLQYQGWGEDCAKVIINQRLAEIQRRAYRLYKQEQEIPPTLLTQTREQVLSGFLSEMESWEY